MLKFVIPLIVALLMFGVLFKGLFLHPTVVDSPLLNKAAPPFSLPQLHENTRVFSPQEMLGKVWLLNVWASWCFACREEHPLLMQMASKSGISIYGLNYKDTPEEAQRWLLQYGNPYRVSAVDTDGRVGIEYGVYGVPETFVIDKQGIIRHKVIGPVTVDELQNKILPLIKELSG